MARVPAFGIGSFRRKCVRRGIIDEVGVCPSVRVDHFRLRQPLVRASGTCTKYGATGFFLKDHSIFTILDPSGKSLPLAGRPCLIRARHYVIRQYHFQLLFHLTDRDILPVFVSSEISKRELAQFQREFVLGRKGQAAQQGEQDRAIVGDRKSLSTRTIELRDMNEPPR